MKKYAYIHVESNWFIMTLKRDMCELSTKAKAFSVEALIGVKRPRTEDNGQTGKKPD